MAKAFQSFQESAFSQAGEKSQTMQALADAVSGNGAREGVQLFSNESMDKIINSLLSSPSNYTPLLHYVLPMQYEDTAAFAEVWINPDAEEDRPGTDAGGKPVTHVLFVFEVDDIGKFETELFVTGKNIELSVYCPEQYLEDFLGVAAEIRKAGENLPYRFEKIKIEKLTAERSLIDVFASLPTRRAGLNVTI